MYWKEYTSQSPWPAKLEGIKKHNTDTWGFTEPHKVSFKSDVVTRWVATIYYLPQKCWVDLGFVPLICWGDMPNPLDHCN